MQIKKFEAVDMPSAIQLIKSELGSDAVILSTKNVRRGKGAFGMFGRPMVEVTAAVDAEFREPDSGAVRGTRSAGAWRRRPQDASSTWLHPLQSEIQGLRDSMETLVSTSSEGTDLQRLMEEVSSFKRILETSFAGREVPPLDEKGSLSVIRDRLIGNDVDPVLSEKIITGIQKRFPAETYASAERAHQTLRGIIGNLFRVQGGIRCEGETPRKVALLGPTGVGKTTTIAKIAADYSLVKKKKVALVTIDTYRIAAIEQLRIYAKILGIPVDVVVHEEDLDKSFEKFSDKDLVLIDTAGRSHRNRSQLKELKTFFAGRQDIEKHLVLSATTKQADMASIIRSFQAVDFHYLLFSKIDEGSRYGTLLNAVLDSGKYVSYVTHGQRVPEDIREARVCDLVNLVVSSKYEREQIVSLKMDA